jgi:RNA polymerase sigma factor (sigma-70 family)
MRKSRRLQRETIISGWLFKTARLTAANFLRSETRRIHREQGAYMQSSLHEGGDSSWKQIAPFLNDAIARLNDKDRNPIVLRYIEDKSLKEVGAALGWSEAAAKKRVSRAVEKLRIFIDSLAAVATNPNQQSLWFMAADGLGNAAASGNLVAIDALIAMSADTNTSVRKMVISGLQQASANQNAKATEALRQMSSQ